MYYEDFYEPSEYDQMVEEFKEALRESVKREWLDKMNSLEEENKKLQEVKKNFNAIKSDFEKAKWECEQESERIKESAKRDAYRARLSELLGNMKAKYWCIKKEIIKKPKCDKCDNNRMVAYITPLGRQAKEYCTCNEVESKYVPCEVVIYRIELYNSKIEAWFVQKDKDNEDILINFSEYYGDKDVIKDEDDISTFAELDERDLYFESLEKCQEYCNYLNSK